MGDLKTLLIGVATSLSIASIGVCINTYVDVQLLKSGMSMQMDNNKVNEDLLIRIDKAQAVQSETIKALSDVVSKIKDK